jgi:hypothetical protein
MPTPHPARRELAPRFQPWIRQIIQELSQRAAKMPPGSIIVPCCGSGQELVQLHEALATKRTIIGIDLAPGMVEVAQQHIRQACAAGTIWGRQLLQCIRVRAAPDRRARPPALARREAGCEAHVSARVGDAMALHGDASLQPVAAVMSCFGLQQLQPGAAQVGRGGWPRLAARREQGRRRQR